jgi:lipopolysaccharide/colanic/teichoic acid biosynthesis glycosyltransferase
MTTTACSLVISTVSPPASLKSQPPHCSTSSKFKRIIDIVSSLTGLVILVLVFVPIAIAIKIDSAGPIFYVQKRYGLRGAPFYICKFRSMVKDADSLKSQVDNEAKGLVFKNKQDPRVTKVGRFLRRTSLDELPQFWNVLMGEMSLVGTRPPTEDEVIHYTDYHWKRLNVKPGMTGEWQVNGRSCIDDFEQILGFDLQYQAKWNPLYDLRIIIRTFYVLLNRQGAC